MGWGDEIWVRLGVFIGAFAALAIAESLLPRRTLSLPRARRWSTNIGIIVINGLVVRAMAALSVPLAAVASAVYAEANGIGLLNWLAMPAGFEFAIALVVLDFAIWLQHVASHKFPWFWRLHQMHHADRDIDVTTAIRFHPVEIGLSMLWKIVVVLALGASPAAVLVFEIILNACAMFSHANVRLAPRIDRIVRTVLVTPDMHRVHHSTLRREHDTNYGFNLAIWDRIFRTYTAQPENGHENMTIGLDAYQTAAPSRLGWCLWLPFQDRR